MTGAELRTQVETILDDTVDEVLFYQLANVAKNYIEDLRPWAMLKALDSSQTATTSAIALPTAWRRTYKLMLGTDYAVEQVPFDEQHIWRNSSNRFCIDVANSVYYLLGATTSDTLYHYYIKTTTDIAAGTSPVWPERFHSIIAFWVAGYIMLGVDADDIFARMSPENKAAAQTLLAGMEAWDMQLQIDAQGGRVQMEGLRGGIDLSLM